MKKKFITPSIQFTLDPVTGEEIGGGTGGSTPDIGPYSYEMWLIIYEDYPEIMDFDKMGDSGTWEDYVAWCNEYGYEPRESDFD